MLRLAFLRGLPAGLVATASSLAGAGDMTPVSRSSSSSASCSATSAASRSERLPKIISFSVCIAMNCPARLQVRRRAPPRIRTGTKPGARTPAAATNLCRHAVSSPRTIPLRRATSEILAPSSKLSATIRAFSSAVQRRRRRSPVINSIRRYEPPSCLASSMASAINSLPTISSCQAVSQTTRTTARWGPLAGYP